MVSVVSCVISEYTKTGWSFVGITVRIILFYIIAKNLFLKGFFITGGGI
jgi:hypothetical protein